jgi:hypothetical protein
VYRLTGEHRDLVKIFSSAEKAEAFIATLERFVNTDVSYEYDEEEIE